MDMDIEKIALDFIRVYKRYKDKKLKASVKSEMKKGNNIKEPQGVGGKTGKNS
ncbi:MAG TPA: hypothetical protein VK213_13805 [Bacteroidales bacterium]|nr:hypothetical protein [Bacteroidales bacterium]